MASRLIVKFFFCERANPCLNIRDSLLKEKVLRHNELRHVYNFIPPHLRPYVNIISEAFDATHEREWRHSGNLSFACSDVMFVFGAVADFAVIQRAGRPVLFGPCLAQLRLEHLVVTTSAEEWQSPTRECKVNEPHSGYRVHCR